MKYPTISMSPVGYDRFLKRFENAVRFDNSEIKIWTLELIIKITNTTMTVQFNPLNVLFILQGENGILYTHGQDSTTHMMYIGNTKYVSTRVFWRDRPSSAGANTEYRSLYVLTHCYYTFGVPSPDNDDNDDNNNNITKLLSFGAIDCVVTVV